MGARKPQPADQRYFPRYLTVSGGFDGKLLLGAGGAEWDAKVIDVSRDGLGVLANVSVQKGDVVELALVDKKVLLRIVYCHDDLIFKGKFRCGLQRTGSAENLANLFSAKGYLQDK